jgi:hypothetical protein
MKSVFYERQQSAENRIVRFRKPEHPIFPENQIFLDLIKNLMLATPNHLPLYFHHWKHAAQ